MGEREIVSTLLPEGVSKERLKEKAEEYGLPYTVLIQRAIQLVIDLDAPFVDMLKDYADGLHTTMGMVIQNMLLRRFAEEEAWQEVRGEGREQLLPEFTIMGKKMLTGLELFNYLKDWFIQEEERERIEELLRQEERGLLTDDDKAFLIKKRAGITWLESKEYAKEQQKEKEAKAKITPKQKEALEYAHERLGKVKEGGK